MSMTLAEALEIADSGLLALPARQAMAEVVMALDHVARERDELRLAIDQIRMMDCRCVAVCACHTDKERKMLDLAKQPFLPKPEAPASSKLILP